MNKAVIIISSILLLIVIVLMIVYAYIYNKYGSIIGTTWISRDKVLKYEFGYFGKVNSYGCVMNTCKLMTTNPYTKTTIGYQKYTVSGNTMKLILDDTGDTITLIKS